MANLSDTITPDQMGVVDAFMSVLRPGMAQTSQTFNKLNTAYLAYTATIEPLLANLDPATVINDGTGLAGAGTVTVADLTSMMAQIQQAIGGFFTAANQQAYIKFAGVNAVVGG